MSETGIGLRLIGARSRMHRANLAIMSGEANASIAEPWAGSEAARAAYAELTEAARYLVSAQDGFDAYCAEKAVQVQAEPDGGT